MTSYLLEAFSGEVTKSEKLAVWQGTERNLPITLFFLIIFGCPGSVAGHGRSLVAVSGGYFLVAEHGLQSTGSVVVVHGLSCPQHVELSLTRD